MINSKEMTAEAFIKYAIITNRGVSWSSRAITLNNKEWMIHILYTKESMYKIEIIQINKKSVEIAIDNLVYHISSMELYRRKDEFIGYLNKYDLTDPFRQWEYDKNIKRMIPRKPKDKSS